MQHIYLARWQPNLSSTRPLPWVFYQSLGCDGGYWPDTFFNIVDFETLTKDSIGEHFQDGDVFFNAMGTTRKQAGSAVCICWAQKLSFSQPLSAFLAILDG